MLWLSLTSLAIWVALLLARYGFWRADQRLDRQTPPTPAVTAPSVLVLIPARDEADHIAASLGSILAQDYPGRVHIVVIDDQSRDDTAARAQSVLTATPRARLRSTEILTTDTLPTGWSGKLWALQSGRRRSSQLRDAHFLWLSDADIVHPPDTLNRLVAKAQQENRALVSLMVRLHCRHFWERLLIPAFVYFFQLIYPFRAVNSPGSAIAAAAGGCILLKRQVFEATGGFEAMRTALIDDVTLGRQIKQSGASIWLGLDDASHSRRQADGLGGLWSMVRRSAYTQLQCRAIWLAGALAGLALTFLLPVLAVLSWPWHGGFDTALAGLVAWGIMALSFVPIARHYHQPPALGWALPLIAALYGAMTVDSAWQHWRGRAAAWKGRTYSEQGR